MNTTINNKKKNNGEYASPECSSISFHGEGVLCASAEVTIESYINSEWTEGINSWQ